MKTWIPILTLIFVMNNVAAQIPQQWARNTVIDTVNVPVKDFWPIFHNLNLEEVAAKERYKRLPKIVKTTPVEGDFSAAGHSRRVHFDNDKTLLESILVYDDPNDFVYELTEVEIALKRFAKRARGWFNFTATPGGKTRIEWTYGFDQQSFLAKWIIKAYIKSTHRHFMNDAMQEIKQQSEAAYTAK